jgi:hypothetical protein
MADKYTPRNAVFIEIMHSAILTAIEESGLGSDQVSDYQSDQVTRLIEALGKSVRSASDLMAERVLSHRPTFRKNYLHAALKGKLIAMIDPNVPRSRNQRYRITARGKKLLKSKDI